MKNMTENDNKIDFTGERFTPECEREIWYEHYHSYAFTKRLVSNKRVLDVASGEGYGSHILSQYAHSVIGIDIDKMSIEHASKKYQNNNLQYIQSSCVNMPIDDASIDVVVSFETLEHLAEQKEMLAEIDRVLKPDGLLVISTPDKKHYSDATGFSNEFHVKELYQDEFKSLLDCHWQQQSWYAQSLSFHSVMQKLECNDGNYSTDIMHNNKFLQDETIVKPMYYIVIASKQENKLLDLPDLHLFADQEQSIYGHYNAVIREHIKYKNKFEKCLKIPIIGRIVKYLIK
jgi:ubiquinone/menaquinone biosynthesis C-methylase UbiE